MIAGALWVVSEKIRGRKRRRRQSVATLVNG
jgi:hypothetical protein